MTYTSDNTTGLSSPWEMGRWSRLGGWKLVAGKLMVGVAVLLGGGFAIGWAASGLREPAVVWPEQWLDAREAGGPAAVVVGLPPGDATDHAAGTRQPVLPPQAVRTP
jgi:hypothetical protein